MWKTRARCLTLPAKKGSRSCLPVEVANAELLRLVLLELVKSRYVFGLCWLRKHKDYDCVWLPHLSYSWGAGGVARRAALDLSGSVSLAVVRTHWQ